MGHFDLGPRMSHPVSKLRIRCKDCFTILHNERGQERHGNYINGFSERKLIVFWAIWSFWNKNGALFTLNLLSGFFIYFTQKEGLRGTWKFFCLFLEKKSLLGQFDIFKSFFNVWLGVVKIEPGHCYYWIFKKSGHD